jgi:RNA polymerase sigma-70 factor (ECF subfamily)
MQKEEITDAEIMQRVAQEPELFVFIVDRYEAKLRRYVTRLMPGLREETDDVLQEVFLNAYVSAYGYDSSLPFSSWLYRIAHNSAVSWLRKKSARPETVDLGEDECLTFLASMEESSEKKEVHLSKDAVSRTLALLPEKHRTPLVLRFLEEKTYEEMSDILRVPVNTVGTLVFRAKRAFADMYQKNQN